MIVFVATEAEVGRISDEGATADEVLEAGKVFWTVEGAQLDCERRVGEIAAEQMDFLEVDPDLTPKWERAGDLRWGWYVADLGIEFRINARPVI